MVSPPVGTGAPEFHEHPLPQNGEVGLHTAIGGETVFQTLRGQGIARPMNMVHDAPPYSVVEGGGSIVPSYHWLLGPSRNYGSGFFMLSVAAELNPMRDLVSRLPLHVVLSSPNRPIGTGV
jgi:hypothetical protein